MYGSPSKGEQLFWLSFILLGQPGYLYHKLKQIDSVL